MFCKHKWEILSEFVSDSVVEKANKLGYELDVSRSSVSSGAFTKKRILVVTCKTCGKLKKYTDDV